LQIHPKVSGGAKVLAEPQSRIRSQVSITGDDLIEPIWRDFDEIGQSFGGQTDFFQLVAEDFSGVYWSSGHDFGLLTVSDNQLFQHSRDQAHFSAIQNRYATGYLSVSSTALCDHFLTLPSDLS
jgi:hypothetical protein